VGVRPVFRLAVLVLLLAAPAAAAQDRPQTTGIAGLTLDHWRGAGGPALLRPTLRATKLPRGRPGLDLALVIFPDGISIFPPLLIVGLQAGLAQRVPVGPISLILKGGAAAIVAAGVPTEGALLHVISGVQGGFGLVLPVDRRSSLRLDVTRHVYTSMGYTTGVWSFGAGVSGPWGKPR
jgi:hypothetical protein